MVVLSARLWRSHFGADPAIVGRAIPLDNQSYTVVGIAADEFQPHLLEDMPGQIRIVGGKGHRGIRAADSRQRLLAGRGPAQGRRDARTARPREMDTVAARIEAANPRSNKDSRVRVLTLREHLVGDVRPAVSLFSAAVFAVLLIACVNVTNLLLARGSSRQQELAVRTALGANRAPARSVSCCSRRCRWRPLPPIGAVVLAEGAMRRSPESARAKFCGSTRCMSIGRRCCSSIALAVAVAVAAGLIPALRLSGLGLQAPGPRTMTADRSQRRLRSTLVAAEVALALMLVSGTGLLLKSFVNLLNVDTGFRKDGVMVLQMFSWDRNPGPVPLRSFFDRVERAQSTRFLGWTKSAACRRCRSSNRTSTFEAHCGCSIGLPRARRRDSQLRQCRDPWLLRRHGRPAAEGTLAESRRWPRHRLASPSSVRPSPNVICAASSQSASGWSSA